MKRASTACGGPKIRALGCTFGLLLALGASPNARAQAVEKQGAIISATRMPLAFSFYGSGRTQIPLNLLLRALERRVLERTQMEVLRLPGQAVSACSEGKRLQGATMGRLHCLSELASNTPPGSRGSGPAPLLLALFAAPGSGMGRLRAFLIDLKIVERLSAPLSRSKKTPEPSELDRLEAAIISEAGQKRRIFRTLENEQDVERFAESVVSEPAFRRAMEEATARIGQSQAELIGNLEGASVSWNGQQIGVASATTKVINIPPGQHALVLERAGFQPIELVVRGGVQERHQVELIPLERGLSIGRWSVFGGGALLAASGVGFLVLSALSSDRRGPVCPLSSSCGGGRFQRLVAPGDEFADPQGAGPLTLPLGYSLVLGGIAWMLNIIDEKGWFGWFEEPWVELAAGLVLGGAAYGFSELADR